QTTDRNPSRWLAASEDAELRSLRLRSCRPDEPSADNCVRISRRVPLRLHIYCCPTVFTLIKIDYDTGENRAYRRFATREVEDALDALRPYIRACLSDVRCRGDGADGPLT